MTKRRFIGFSESWCDNSIGYRDFYFLWFRVWSSTFSHSTANFD